MTLPKAADNSSQGFTASLSTHPFADLFKLLVRIHGLRMLRTSLPHSLVLPRGVFQKRRSRRTALAPPPYSLRAIKVKHTHTRRFFSLSSSISSGRARSAETSRAA